MSELKPSIKKSTKILNSSRSVYCVVHKYLRLVLHLAFLGTTPCMVLGDNVCVQSAMEWTSSVHFAHAQTCVRMFLFKIYGRDCLGTYLTHAQTCDSVRVQSATE